MPGDKQTSQTTINFRFWCKDLFQVKIYFLDLNQLFNLFATESDTITEHWK